jgi:hypothetical protein
MTMWGRARNVLNHMMGSVGALRMGECKNISSILGDGSLKSLAMLVLQGQVDSLRWICF